MSTQKKGHKTMPITIKSNSRSYKVQVKVVQ